MFITQAFLRPARAAALLAASSLLACLGGCATDPKLPPTLFERLGGAANVATVSNRTIERAAADPRTRRSFDGIKLKAVQVSLAQQVCSLSGGGCVYEGETMARAHRDARITASEFDALVTILREELDRSGTDPTAKNELLRLLAPMKRDIVLDAAAPATAAAPAAAASAAAPGG